MFVFALLGAWRRGGHVDTSTPLSNHCLWVVVLQGRGGGGEPVSSSCGVWVIYFLLLWRRLLFFVVIVLYCIIYCHRPQRYSRLQYVKLCDNCTPGIFIRRGRSLTIGRGGGDVTSPAVGDLPQPSPPVNEDIQTFLLYLGRPLVHTGIAPL